jgi:hypothetical protein
MQIKINQILFLFSVLFSSQFLFAQSVPSAAATEFSPYSRFGYGQAQLNGNAISQGLAGATTAFVNDSFPCIYINPSNPASLSSVFATALEFGAQAKSSTYYAPNATNKASISNFHYAALAVPLKKYGGLGFGISPEYQTGYSLAKADSINNYSYTGNGGLYKLFLGTGIKPFYKFQNKYKRSSKALQQKNIGSYKRNYFLAGILSQTALGVNANYYFGNTSNASRNTVRFSNTSASVSNKILNNDITGYSVNFGAITGFTIDSIKVKSDSTVKYKKLKNAINVSFGYTTYMQSSINNKESYLAYNDILFSGGGVRDTILYENAISTKSALPAFQKFGINFKLGEKLNLSADYGTDKWKNQIFKYQSNVFKDQTTYAFGAQYTPAKRILGKNTFSKRVTYRLGFRMSDGYLKINNTAIETKAIHAGISLPLGRTREYAFLHLNGEYGIIGTRKNNLIQENYFKLVIGLSFNDIWFVKPRID